MPREIVIFWHWDFFACQRFLKRSWNELSRHAHMSRVTIIPNFFKMDILFSQKSSFLVKNSHFLVKNGQKSSFFVENWHFWSQKYVHFKKIRRNIYPRHIGMSRILFSSSFQKSLARKKVPIPESQRRLFHIFLKPCYLTKHRNSFWNREFFKKWTKKPLC